MNQNLFDEKDEELLKNGQSAEINIEVFALYII